MPEQISQQENKESRDEVEADLWQEFQDLQNLSDKLESALEKARQTGDTTEAKRLKAKMEKKRDELQRKLEKLQAPRIELDEEGHLKEARIRVGTFSSVEDIVEKLESEDCEINPLASEVINSEEFKLSEKKETLNLVVKTPEDLGLEGTPITEDIFEAAKAQGLELLPPEAALQLRLAYEDQPESEWLAADRRLGRRSEPAPRLPVLRRPLALRLERRSRPSLGL